MRGWRGGLLAGALIVAMGGCASGLEGPGTGPDGDGGVGADGAPLGPDGGPPGSDGGTAEEDAGGPPGSDGGSSDGGSSDGDGGQELLGPPYPIVLAHGFFGFDELLGIIDYWWQIPAALEMAGETQVFVTAVDPFNGSDVRGGELIAQIEDILATTGHRKVNLIGHSQGGLDARVVAHERPDLVASVLTVATPHGGSPVADLVETLSGPVLDELLGILAEMLGTLYGQPTEAEVLAALDLFSEDGIAAFNATYTDSPGVAYYSVTGTSDLTSPSAGPCEVSSAPTAVSRWYGERDPIDSFLYLTEDLIDGNPVGTYPNVHPNDGLVRVEDAQWGTFLGCVPADHLDEVGQLLGDSPGWSALYGTNDFDHRELFVDLVDYLRAQGH
ncbi:MAG: esterase/lipase family protein [Myxococcota bacterium]